jgi:4a-hydroxytetrahydrobiopterin dehydratase
MSASAIAQARRAVPDWRVRGRNLEREFKFPDFARALRFVDRVGSLAEKANHHPDIFLHGWNRVRLTLSTHSAGGLTAADFALAGKIEKAPAARTSTRA